MIHAIFIVTIIALGFTLHYFKPDDKHAEEIEHVIEQVLKADNIDIDFDGENTKK